MMNEPYPASGKRQAHEAGKCITLAEVAQHSRPDSHWTVVDGKVYDLTTFLPKHPGGNLIQATGGSDATVLYHTYHFERRGAVDKILAKYYLGEYAGESPKMGGFWFDCAARVAAKLATLPDRGRRPMRTKVLFWVDVVGYFGFLAASLLLTPQMMITQPLAVAFVYIGFFFAFYLRFQQQTHANCHLMLFSSHAFANVANHIMFLGASNSAAGMSFVNKGNPRKWMHLPRSVAQHEWGKRFSVFTGKLNRGPFEHQAIHHVRGATLDDDACKAGVLAGGKFRLDDYSPLKPSHKRQANPVFRVGIMTVQNLIFKQSVLHVLQAMDNSISMFKIREYSRFAASLLGLGSALLIMRLNFLPLMLLHRNGFLFAAVAVACNEWVNFFRLFFAQHKWDAHISEAEADQDWGKANCQSSVSYQPTNSLNPVTWFQDGTCPSTLSYHTEHTLFPGVNYFYLKDIAPVIEQCAAEHGVPYHKWVGRSKLDEEYRMHFARYAQASSEFSATMAMLDETLKQD